MNRNLTSSTKIASIREEEKTKLLSFLFWLTLVFIGSSVIFYVFVINPVGAYSDAQGFIEPSRISQKTNHHQSTKILRNRKNWIKYDGVMEANTEIHFKLSGYDASAKYTFDFGDGTKKRCRSSRIAHAYTKPGKYKVSVKVAFDNKVTEAWTETLTIKKGIVVDSAAFE